MNKSRDLYLLFLVILLFWALSAFLLISIDSDPQSRGLWGDMFGGINALFSGFAFAGIIYTIHLQEKEIQDGKREAKITRGILQKQNFEETFFRLLKHHDEVIQSINVEAYVKKKEFGKETSGVKPLNGLKCFDYFTNRYEFWYNDYKGKHRTQRSRDSFCFEKAVRCSYENFYEDYQFELGPYFSLLYEIALYVKKYPIENKKQYFNFLRAKLSCNEMLMLFYHCTSEKEKNFKLIIEEFCLFSGLSIHLLIDDNHRSLYREEAFF